MAISKKDVEYVARLARLQLEEEEKERFTNQLGHILDYIEQLNELDTENVAPTSHVLALKNVWRKDEVKPSLPQEEALANAPQSSEEFFLVPKVIDN